MVPSSLQIHNNKIIIRVAPIWPAISILISAISVISKSVYGLPIYIILA